jgi:uncharacterized protein (DUF3084 family)
MDQWDEQCKRVNGKLQQLLKQYQQLQKENLKLKDELRQVVTTQDNLAAEAEKLQQQVEILKVSKGEMSESEKKIFEKRINGYIREIDRCISLLNE